MYSATLFVVDAEVVGELGEDLARRRLADDGAVRRRAGVAPRPAVGLDDEARGSQPGLGRADEDAPALLAAQDGVRRRLADTGRCRWG